MIKLAVPDGPEVVVPTGGIERETEDRVFHVWDAGSCVEFKGRIDDSPFVLTCFGDSCYIKVFYEDKTEFVWLKEEEHSACRYEENVS